RKLGPVTWVVLEAIASSTTAGGSDGSACSSRSLAELVGVSKDTVARSIRTLIDHGLVIRFEQRDELTGRFGPVSYRLDLEAVGITVVTDEPEITDRAACPNRTTAATRTDQLTLI